MNQATRDRVEVGVFDVALIFVGILTLPATAGMAASVANGWVASLVQASLLFVVRVVARYAWRRFFRGLEK